MMGLGQSNPKQSNLTSAFISDRGQVRPTMAAFLSGFVGELAARGAFLELDLAFGAKVLKFFERAFTVGTAARFFITMGGRFLDFRGGNAFLPVFVVLEGLVQGVGPQVRTMEFILGKSSQFIGDTLIRDLSGFSQGLPHGHIAHHAGDGNRRTAAKCLKFNVSQSVILDPDIKGHHVAADRISYLSHPVRIFDHPDIVRVLKMFHDFFAVHHLAFSSKYLV
jgi:hypothetical protein